jgi:membrane protease YdiL (CAAX protease family)
MNSEPTSQVQNETFSQKLKPILHSRAAWLFTLVWIASLIYLGVSGNGITGSISFAAGILLFCALTVVLTKADPLADQAQTVQPVHQRWLQLGIVVLVICITAYSGYLFNMHPGQPTNIPLWSTVVNFFGSLGAQYLGPLVDNSPALAGANPAKYVFIPLVFLLLSGARISGLGFRRGHRVWQIIILWAAIPVIFLSVQIISGAASLLHLFRVFIGHFLKNGFSEEFLFRGAFQTRLRLFMKSDWALVVQALVFGIWHLGFDTQTMGGDVIGGLALGIASHSIFGLAMGVLFQRTRNLIVPSIIHVVINMFGS